MLRSLVGSEMCIRDSYQYCRCIADQPGRVPEHEIIQMETIMDELHTIVTSEGFDEHLSLIHI